jgi:uncharacterized protein with GYD domain
MPTFMLSLNWTDQGIRGVKDAPKRSQAARSSSRRIDNINALRRRAGDHVLPQFAGYMEGAIRSGFEAARACLTRFL